MTGSGTKFGGGELRYRAANSTAANFQVSTRRVAVPSAVSDVLCLLASASLPIIDLNEWKGVRLTPIGKGADNSTYTYRVLLGWYAVASRSVALPAGADHVKLSALGYGTVTLSSSLTRPTGSAVIAANEIRGDGLTWTLAAGSTTPRGMGSALWTSLGALAQPTAYSPANNDEDACLIIPDTYDADFMVIDDTINGGTATEMNWLVERWRG